MKRKLAAFLVTALTAVSGAGCNHDREVTAPEASAIGGISAIEIGGVSATACGQRYTADSVWPDCVLKPTDVEQPPEPISDNPPTGGGSGGTSGTDTPTDPGYPADPTDPTSYDPHACIKDPATNQCKLTPVDSAQLAQIKAAIDRLKEDTEACAGAKMILQSMYNQGVAGQRFRWWSGTWNMPGVGPILGTTDYSGNSYGMLLNRRSLGDPLVLAHEGIHLWLTWLLKNNPARWHELMAPYNGRPGNGPGDHYIYDGDKDEQCVRR